MDFFCLAHNGIRVGYPSAALLRTLPRSERRRVRNRVVIALTANPYYSLHGVRAGARLNSAVRRLHLGKGFVIGLNTWYLVPGAASDGVLKVRHGVIEEIGIADARWTATRRGAGRFLKSFY